MNLARPNLAFQCRYGHRRAIFTYIYWVYLVRAKHVGCISFEQSRFIELSFSLDRLTFLLYRAKQTRQNLVAWNIRPTQIKLTVTKYGFLHVYNLTANLFSLTKIPAIKFLQ